MITKIVVRCDVLQRLRSAGLAAQAQPVDNAPGSQGMTPLEGRCPSFSGMLLSFCNYFARWLQKIVATCDAMCWFFWDAMIFCNNFARWLQKIVATCDAMCWFSGMLLSFVTTLQDDYKDSSSTRWVGFSGMLQLCKMITKDSSNMRCDVFVFMRCHDLL